MDINYIIKETRKRCDRKNIIVEVSEEVQDYLKSNQYSIEQYSKLGIYLKSPEQYTIHGEQEKFEEFVSVVSSEVVRPFKNCNLRQPTTNTGWLELRTFLCQVLVKLL